MFLRLLFSFSILFCVLAQAKISVYTDNPYDVESFKQLENRSLSAESTIFALGIPKVTVELMPFKRALKLMDDRKPVCVINRIKNDERGKKYLFSNPINIFLNRRLYQLAELETTDITQPVIFKELFEKYPDRKLIVSSNLSYGNELDELIANIDAKYKLIRHGAIHHSRGIIRMFVEGRGHYALIEPFELMDNEFGLGDKTRSFSIAGVPAYMLGHLMCANTSETDAFIEQVNDYLSQKVNRAKLFDIHKKYYAPADYQLLESAFQTYFK